MEKFMKTAIMLFLAALAVVATTAFAGSDANAFDSIWTEVSGWALWARGKSIALLSFGTAVFLGIVKQNWLGAMGAFFVAMVMANAESIISFFLDAGVPVVL